MTIAKTEKVSYWPVRRAEGSGRCLGWRGWGRGWGWAAVERQGRRAVAGRSKATAVGRVVGRAEDRVDKGADRAVGREQGKVGHIADREVVRGRVGGRRVLVEGRAGRRVEARRKAGRGRRVERSRSYLP